MLNTLSICMYFYRLVPPCTILNLLFFPLFVGLGVLPACACAPCACSTHRDQKKAPNSLELELIVMYDLVGAGNQTQVLWEISHCSNH